MRSLSESRRHQLIVGVLIASLGALALVDFMPVYRSVRVGLTLVVLCCWAIADWEKRNMANQLEDLRAAVGRDLRSRNFEAIGQLAAGVAHEINTPVQYVGDNINFLSGAFTDLIGAVDPTESDDLDFLRTEVPIALEQSAAGVARVAEIVRALKSAAHPGTDGVVPTDINQLISETSLVARGEWKRVAQLELDLDPSLPDVECMRGEIGQVMLNLIVNSAHAVAARRAIAMDHGTPFGGRITITSRAVGESIMIAVDDNGIGVPDALVRKIFDPYFTTKAVGTGSGQGLAISHTVVYEHHGGSIDVARNRDGGARFTIHLPIYHRTAAMTSGAA